MPMEENLRPAGIVVKKRNSSGCLIVRKKGDAVGGVGAYASRNGFAVKNERKRPRLAASDSEPSEEDLPLPPLSRRGVAAETIRVCNGLTVPGKHVAEDSELTSWNGDGEEKRKRNRLDVFDFDENEGIDVEMMLRRRCHGGGMGKRFMGSPSLARSGSGMDFESGSSRHAAVASRKNVYFNRDNSLSSERKRDVERMPLSAVREKYMNNSDKLIRVQGKNGVLKVHVNKKKKLAGSSSDYDQWKSDDNRKGSIYEGMVKKSTVVLHSSTDEHRSEKHSAILRMDKNQQNRQKFVHADTNDSSEEDLGDTDLLLKQRSKDAVRRNVIVYSLRAEKKRASFSGIDREELASKISKSIDGDLDDINASLRQKSQEVEACVSPIKASLESEKTPKAKVLASGKGVTCGSGTEKQKLRENIRNMLLSAGWEIDYKPRRNRDYLDAIYISPSGTSYWSIIKAYDALQKQLDNEAEVNGGDRSAFVVSDETLSQLTRKTRKKMEKEMKKQSSGTESENARRAARKKTSYVKEEAESMQSDSAEEKLSSFMKQGVKSFKEKTIVSGLTALHNKSAKASSSDLSPQRRKSRKLGRCNLLIRSSDKSMNSESDSFVPYTGKRTLLSWLIDSGVVELSQKVKYMNRRKTRVLLEGWITRDGIHCGCCSKILTVSKFETHGRSKLRQSFENIYLDSGVSLLQCQVDAWNRQEESDRMGFHRIDVDGDDPNDDTCSLCGDGGDLICCDGCPSTFHQSCLNIQMLPQGDWHCPNCTCRYCGLPGERDSQNHPVTVSELLTCSLCQRRFHKSCIKDINMLAVDSVTSDPSFCSQKCRELFEHLQKYFGLKHELEEGFSWSLIRRIDPESDLSLQGLPQRVECNSKLAVALSIMDECFLPIVDRRTGINMIHNVLYNCRSNFSRINYGGFYTVILERGDEIISAASLRIHGTQLAEMPFIGTRHIYRRQGMCRRLFSAIESVLRSLKVEKLVIPAISELMHTWTVVFGFTPAVESLKQEMRSLNMLVFPSLDMLQKVLFKQETTGSEGTAAFFSGAAAMEIEEGKETASNPPVSDKSNGDLSTEPVQEMGDKVEDEDCEPNSQGGSSNDTYVVNSSSDDARVHISTELAVKSAEEIEEKEVSNPPTEVCANPIKNGDMNDSCGMEAEFSSVQSSPPLEGSSAEKSKEIVKSIDVQSAIKGAPLSDVSQSVLEVEAKLRWALKEDETAKYTIFVDSDSNCLVSHGEGSKSYEPFDGGKCPPRDMEEGNKSVASYESVGNLPSSSVCVSGDANKVN